MIENNLLHEHSVFLRGCFRVQRNLFSYLWNLKTLILAANLKEDQQILAIWESQNVCFSECRKKCAELWDSVSIYRGQKTLKSSPKVQNANRDSSFCEKIEKGVPYRHPKGVGPKPKRSQFGTFEVPFGTPKVPNGALGCQTFFYVQVPFDSVFAPRRVFILNLWLFYLFSG